MSASRIDTFKTCPFKYFLTYETYKCSDCGYLTFVSEWLRLGIDLSNKICLNPYCRSHNIKKIELPNNWGAANGSINHKVLELYGSACMEGKDDWRLQWDKNLIDGYMGRLNGYDSEETLYLMVRKNESLMRSDYNCNSCEIKQKYGICDLDKLNNLCPKDVLDKNLQMLSFNINKYRNHFRNNCLATEKKFIINIDENVVLNGYIDLVLFIGDKTIESVDYKTGTWCKNFKDLQTDTQARVYSVALKHEYPDYDYHLLTFDYFQRHPVTVAFSDEQDKDTIKMVKRCYEDIRTMNYPSRIPLRRDGTLFWKCRNLCSREICDDVWRVFKQRYGKNGL